jgi:hypothetical protein
MSNIKIAIPSYKRVDRVRVFETIPESYRDNVYMFVRVEEEEEYRNKWGHRCHIIPIDGVTGVATTMDKMVKYFNDERIWCIDDDVTLHHGVIDHKGIVRKSKEEISEEEFYKLISFIDEQMDMGYDYGMVKYMLFPRGSDWYPTKKMTTPYGSGNIFFNLSKINRDHIDYKKTGDEWCDGYVAINLYKYGHDPIVIAKWLAYPNKWNAPGGCSVNRSVKGLNEGATILAKELPEFVKLRTSKRKDLAASGLVDEATVYTASIRLNPKYRVKQ